MNFIVSGATGFSGFEVTKQALADPEVDRVMVLSRRATGLAHPKLHEVLLPDFLNYSAVDFRGYDACIWCLGISETQVGEAEYVKITYDFPVAAAEAMVRAEPHLRFCFVSGRNADPSEKGKRLFTRIKGRAEKRLSEITPNAYLFRPGYIRPTKASGPRRDFARFFAPVGTLMDFFIRDFSVGCDDLARALLRVAKNGAEARLFENKDIRGLGAT